jgi:hypothetical protein
MEKIPKRKDLQVFFEKDEDDDKKSVTDESSSSHQSKEIQPNLVQKKLDPAEDNGRSPYLTTSEDQSAATMPTYNMALKNASSLKK